MKFGRAPSRDSPHHGAPQTLSLDPDSVDVEAARRGDLEAFDRLVARHQNRVFNVCRWIIGGDDEAADAAQEAFVRAFRFLPKFRGEAAFGTWLGQIATNVARDFAKKKKNAPHSFSSLTSDEDPDFEPVSGAISPAESLLKAERQRAVQSALGEIPVHFRTVLVLYDLQGYSYEECAAQLELPLGTVKSRLSRARNALREALGPHRELFEN